MRSLTFLLPMEDDGDIGGDQGRDEDIGADQGAEKDIDLVDDYDDVDNVLEPPSMNITVMAEAPGYRKKKNDPFTTQYTHTVRVSEADAPSRIPEARVFSVQRVAAP